MLGAFLILSVLVIATFFVDFGMYAGLVYILFALELGYLIWVATTKKSLTPLRKIIGIAVLLFFPLLLLAIASFFFELGILEKFAYLLFLVDFLFLLVLFIRKTIRNIASRRVGRPVEVETPFERVTKWAVYAVPAIFLIYLAYTNLIPSHEFVYFYDVGSENEGITLTPIQRVSEIKIQNGLQYRELISNLVYFNLQVPKNYDKVKIKIKFMNPKGDIFRIAGRDKKEWHYKYKNLFYPELDKLKLNIIQEGNRRLYQKENQFRSIGEFLTNVPKNSIIATDQDLKSTTNIIQDYTPNQLSIGILLRGNANFYIYVKDRLDLKIVKRDINWYEGEDTLNVNLYDLEGNAVSTMTLNDDGINISNKNLETNSQHGNLIVDDIKAGIYRLELTNNGDMIIEEILINQNKIVTNQLFLADNELYGGKTKPVHIYTKTSSKGVIKFKTWHEAGIQTIKINDDHVTIDQINKDFSYDLEKNKEFIISTEKNNLIMTSSSYLSFDKDSYFEPFQYQIVPLIRDLNWLENNVDFIFTEYKTPQEEDGWRIGEAEFEIDQLFSLDGNLNFALDSPNSDLNNTVLIDWIEVRYIKKGVLK